jgi:hypothetical protein
MYLSGTLEQLPKYSAHLLKDPFTIEGRDSAPGLIGAPMGSSSESIHRHRWRISNIPVGACPLSGSNVEFDSMPGQRFDSCKTVMEIIAQFQWSASGLASSELKL